MRSLGNGSYDQSLTKIIFYGSVFRFSHMVWETAVIVGCDLAKLVSRTSFNPTYI